MTSPSNIVVDMRGGTRITLSLLGQEHPGARPGLMITMADQYCITFGTTPDLAVVRQIHTALGSMLTRMEAAQ